MDLARRTVFLFASVAAPAWAQTAALDLKLPADAAPEPTVVVGTASDATAPAAALPALPALHDDGRGNPRQRAACDDSTYGQPQVHGNVGMGVVAGNRVSGNYETGSVQISKAFGTCDDPKGVVSVSVDVGQGNLNRRHRHGARHRDAAN